MFLDFLVSYKVVGLSRDKYDREAKEEENGDWESGRTGDHPTPS